MSSEYRIVLSAAGSRDEAQRIAHALVERQLAACVNLLGPMNSIYRWKGQVEEAQEWLLLIKTTAAGFAAVRDAVRQLHSYELPECIAVDIAEGSPDYLRWLGEQVK